MTEPVTNPEPCRTAVRFIGEPDHEYPCTLPRDHDPGHSYASNPRLIDDAPATSTTVATAPMPTRRRTSTCGDIHKPARWLVDGEPRCDFCKDVILERAEFEVRPIPSATVPTVSDVRAEAVRVAAEAMRRELQADTRHPSEAMFDEAVGGAVVDALAAAGHLAPAVTADTSGPPMPRRPMINAAIERLVREHWGRDFLAEGDLIRALQHHSDATVEAALAARDAEVRQLREQLRAAQQDDDGGVLCRRCEGSHG